MESLRREIGQAQITTQIEMYEFCNGKLTRPNRKFFYVSSQTVQTISKLQTQRFSKSKTVKGTRDFHSFRVVASGIIEARQYSLQSNGKRLIFEQTEFSVPYNINDHVAVKCDQNFNVGIIKNIQESEILVEFYKKSVLGNSFKFSWSGNRATHAFLSSDIICTTTELIPTSRGHRYFILAEKDLTKILRSMGSEK